LKYYFLKTIQVHEKKWKIFAYLKILGWILIQQLQQNPSFTMSETGTQKVIVEEPAVTYNHRKSHLGKYDSLVL